MSSCLSGSLSRAGGILVAIISVAIVVVIIIVMIICIAFSLG